MKLLNYIIKEILYESNKTIVYRAIDDKTEKSVVIKKKEILNNSEDYASLKKEYELIQKIKSPHILKAIDYIDGDGENLIVMEDIGGLSLQKIMREESIPISNFYTIALHVALGLSDIHKAGFIHRDISLANIIWSKTIETAKIIDLNITIKKNNLSKAETILTNIVGTLNYISPEQTGRINYTIDYRSDLYSLGIVFYEILSGKLPFESTSEVELIHSHIAVEAVPLIEVNHDIPEKLSELVAKLMAKSPDDRYQTASGLINDLEKCFNSYINVHEYNFEIGENDFSGLIHFPQKLYDRENEKEQIKAAYRNVNSNTKGIVLINGEHGVGKTYFIERFGNYVIQNHGLFVTGRFSVTKKNMPFSGIKEIITEYVYLIFSEGKETIEQKRKNILEAIGNNGRVITSILPELEELIGTQPEIEPLEGILAENRFNYVLKQLLVSLIEHNDLPVLFLDDLQFIDSASLKLINHIINDSEVNGLMIILAYNINEIHVESNLYSLINELQKNRKNLLLSLQTIKKEAFNIYLADTFNIDTIDPEFEKVSNTIYSKTSGNPYFTKELLSQLEENKSIQFNFNVNKWAWDLEKIQSITVTKNVADLILLKIKELDIEISNLLRKAACVGENFDIKIIYEISELGKDKVDQLLDKAIELRLISEYESGKYSFLHPNIYSAFDQLNDITAKREIDLKIGNYLIHNSYGQIFKILSHYNSCNALFNTKENKLVLAILNQEAGTESMKLLGYDIALVYFEIAINLVQDNYWKTDYNFVLELFSQTAEAAYLGAYYKKNDEYVNQVIVHAHSIYDKINAYTSLLKSKITQSKYNEALDLGMEILRSLGVNKLKLPNSIILIKELLLTLKNVYFKDINLFTTYKNNPDKHNTAIKQIMRYCSTAAFHTGSPLLAFFCFKSLNYISSKKIRVDDIHYTLISYAMLIAHSFGNINKAKQIALAVEEYYFNQEFDHLINKTAIVNYHLINHLHRPIERSIEPIFENYERCLNNGDIEFAANSIMLHAYYIFWAGRPLSELEEIITGSARKLKNLNFLTFYYCMKILQQFVYNQSKSENYSIDNIEGEYYSEIEMVPIHKANHDITSLNTIYYLKLMQNVLFENYSEAYETGLELEKYKKANYGTPTIPLIQMYFSISISMVFNTLSDNKKRNAKSYVETTLKQLKKLSIASPQNYLHKYYLVSALYYDCIKVRRSKALDYYSNAIKASKKSKIYNELALVYEFAGKYYIKEENTEISETYLLKAWKLYKDWGGKAKTAQLQHKYGKLINHYIEKKDSESILSTSSGISQDVIDIESIIKASQMISEELKVKELQDKLIKILMQNAGAQKGVLIGVKEEELYILNVNNSQNESSISQDSSKSNVYPQSLANYVLRNANQLVFDCLSNEKKFKSDKYISANNPKSVICSPIIYNQKVQGIIYLENNLLEGAFTQSHIRIINLLSSQIAISLENAQLYENLEEKVEQRTEELNVANESLQIQKHKVEELYQSVSDSILSAYRIQQAIFPPMEILKENLKDFFILFKPRNVVSGDFYWYKKSNDILYIAAADCTGHGVPGAFMSILGILLLDNIIIEFPKAKSSEILEKLRMQIKTSLKQTLSSDSLREGLDIAFCSINTKTNILQFSGAYNPLYLYRNNELSEIKATRNPVGIHLKELPFDNHEIKLEPKDKIYLFSDGFLDQMGGPNGHKFMAQKLKKLLLENHQSTMNEQYKVYEETFNNWRGEQNNQTDDLLLMGFEYF